MTRQLRVDIARTSAGVRADVRAFPSGSRDLAEALQRWLAGTLRFVDVEGGIRDPYRTVFELTDQLIAITVMTTHDSQPARIARSHLLTAIADLETAIFERSRVSAAGERVGLGVAGSRL